ncbi:MAG: 50S ribosomal protein L29 [Bacteroidia bacterium]|nr:50S ribosomal protein L29 [Bacteroidales bacterium]NCD41619.1 50S ribosomal protein L29 [Bacteroidia bacterium]MDD2322796.1 50S ribosomal protein L29 [Bacteroidales bacterium]MDD3010332.1 50S ribosomal protein L29 [Bacteroidales bacterium]MDD3960559.1 50S ribosomal protein L29 [Bacteroidales bacterium]
MEQQVIKELSTPELQERLEQEQIQLNKLKLNHTVSPIENPNKIREYKRAIARLKTELQKRAIEEQKNK